MITIFDGEVFAEQVTLTSGERIVRWGWRAVYVPDKFILGISDMLNWREVPIKGTPTIAEPGRFEGDTEGGTHIIVRKIDPADAMIYENPLERRGFPVPIDVLEGWAAMTITGQMSLQAVMDDEGLVVTLLLITDIGMYARFDGAWQRITDPAEWLDGRSVVDVTDEAVGVWDPIDQVGETLPASEMPLADGVDPAVTLPSSILTSPGTSATTAAGAVLVEMERGVTVPINSADDVPAAIAAAETDPESRWYVERRLQALGLEAEFQLPWSQDA